MPKLADLQRQHAEQVLAVVSRMHHQAATLEKLTPALSVFASTARPMWDRDATKAQKTAGACVEFVTSVVRELMSDRPDRETVEDCAERLHAASQAFRECGDMTAAGVAFGAGIIATDYAGKLAAEGR